MEASKPALHLPFTVFFLVPLFYSVFPFSAKSFWATCFMNMLVTSCMDASGNSQGSEAELEEQKV